MVRSRPTVTCSELELMSVRFYILFQDWDKTCYRYGYRPVVPPVSLKTQQS